MDFRLVIKPLLDILAQQGVCTDTNSLALSQALMCITTGWRDTVLRNIPGIITAFIVLALALFIDDRVQSGVERLVGLRNGQRELARLLGRMARFGVLILALLYILSIFKLNTLVTSFVASLGIAGLVIAFALQDITKNFAAGVLLLLLRPFRLDDRIKVKDFEGFVTDISLRATALRTLDGEEVLVPNADVYGSPIINFTRYPRRRYHTSLTLPATLPIESVRQRLEAALRELPGLEREPAPQVVVTAAGDTLMLDARYWLLSQAADAALITTQVVERLQGLIEEVKAQPRPDEGTSDRAEAQRD